MGKKIDSNIYELVSALYPENSSKEISEKTGISISSVHRIAASLGLKKTKEQVLLIQSRIRNSMIQDEKRRIIFGMGQKTNIKVVTDRKKHTIKYRLRRRGYLIGNNKDHLFYTDQTPRNIHYEEMGKKHGLSFERIS